MAQLVIILLRDVNLLFDETTVNITTKGRRHLGTVIGSVVHKAEYLSGNMKIWIKYVT